MSDYEHTVTISAAPEAIFAYVADLRNLADYLPEVAFARLLAGGRDPHPGSAHYFQADPQRLRLEWGWPDSGYRGRLEINAYSGPDDMRSLVTVHLAFGEPGARPAAHEPGYDRGVLQALEDTLNRIQRVVEERNGTFERTTTG